MDIEEELKVVGQNLQTLEVGEEKTIQREERSQEEILDLLNKLKQSEYRGEQAEMNIQEASMEVEPPAAPATETVQKVLLLNATYNICITVFICNLNQPAKEYKNQLDTIKMIYENYEKKYSDLQ